jgi:hypothetical protein
MDESVAVSMSFFGLGVMNNAVKPDCVLPIEDNGSSNGDRSSGKVIIIKINEVEGINNMLQS